ncbi:hypothetical protein [Saccharothrix obliqua]|uniref:hypothetical protein n=1 Tax=Saccharothrix obliqua TaxID=2861747 RepID=UPI001C5DA3C3|nr:hypothetical protein [Saccharothrix obliqua]MBW4718455.1 hypothetical protein [Saccharothrix obliqua]
MKRFATLVLAALATTALTAPVANAAAGEVIVYTAEVVPVAVFKDPKGCHAVPNGAHVLVNRTDEEVEVYGVPGCLGLPILAVEKSYGSHVPPAAASFRA